MKTIKEIIEQANSELKEAIIMMGDPNLFEVVPGGTLNGEPSEDEPFTSIEYEIIMTFGNIKRTHALIIGWNEHDDIGLESGEDGDLETITYGNLFKSLYFDLAMEGLADEFLSTR